jgi:hypothetical protein
MSGCNMATERLVLLQTTLQSLFIPESGCQNLRRAAKDQNFAHPSEADLE